MFFIQKAKNIYISQNILSKHTTSNNNDGTDRKTKKCTAFMSDLSKLRQAHRVIRARREATRTVVGNPEKLGMRGFTVI